MVAKALGVYLRLDPITLGGVALLLHGPGAIEAKAVGLPMDFAVLAGDFMVLVLLAARQYPKIVP
ncbi:MAG: hypothetical protein WA807_06785 [Steroidobacteraceae bacterium]